MTESTKPMMVASLWVIVVLIILTCTGCTRQVYTPSVSPAKDAPAKLEASARSIEEIAKSQIVESEAVLKAVGGQDADIVINFAQRVKLQAGQLLAQVAELSRVRADVEATNKALDAVNKENAKLKDGLKNAQDSRRLAVILLWVGIILNLAGLVGVGARVLLDATIKDVFPIGLSVLCFGGGLFFILLAKLINIIPDWVLYALFGFGLLVLVGAGLVATWDNWKKLFDKEN